MTRSASKDSSAGSQPWPVTVAALGVLGVIVWAFIWGFAHITNEDVLKLLIQGWEAFFAGAIGAVTAILVGRSVGAKAGTEAGAKAGTEAGAKAGTEAGARTAINEIDKLRIANPSLK